MGQDKVIHQEKGPELPPPGDERREELKRRADALEQKGEELAGELEMERANPAAYEPINDIQADIDGLSVSNGDHEKYHYVWAQTGGSGRFVQAKRVQGYEIVSGRQAPEAHELLQADGTRRLGDVILMRIPRERYRKLREQAEYRRQAREQGVSAKALELADKYAATGVKVHETAHIPEHIQKIMDRRNNAKRKAAETQDRWLREGRMPGMPAPGME